MEGQLKVTGGKREQDIVTADISTMDSHLSTSCMVNLAITSYSSSLGTSAKITWRCSCAVAYGKQFKLGSGCSSSTSMPSAKFGSWILIMYFLSAMINRHFYKY